jgi:hypothetical protein
MTTYSPYACSPVAIDVGPGLATYWVQKQLLHSPKWSTTDAEVTLCLPGVSAATGHTLVHYLYTGKYQTLEAKGEEEVAPAHIKLKQALLTFVLASAYDLHDLKSLAKEQIEIYGSRMALVQILDTVKEEFSKMTWCWFHEYLQARADEQFDLDFTIFKSKAFIESVGEGTLYRFMTSHLLERFSKELTHTLQRRGSHCLDKEKPDTVLDDVENAAVKTHDCPCYYGGHQTGMNKGSDEMSFEFPNASCEDVADVISLENSVWDETSPTPPELEPVPPPEPGSLAETEPEPVPEPVKGKPAGSGWGSTWGISLRKIKKVEPPPEPEPEPTLPEPELKPEPAVDPFAGLSKSRKMKLQVKMKKDAKLKEEEDAKRKKEEDTAELVRQAKEDEAERIRLEEEEAEKNRIEEEAAVAAAAEPVKEDDSWGLAATAPVKKSKKKKKGVVEEEPLPPPPESEPEPVIEPEPTPPAEEKQAEGWDDWGAAVAPVKMSKKKKKKKGAIEEEPPPPPLEPEVLPEPEPEPEPVPEREPTKDDNEGGDWDSSSIWGTGKEKKKGKNDSDPQPKPEPSFPEPLAMESAVQESDAVEEPLTKSISKRSGKSANDDVEDLISLDDRPPVEEKEKKKSKISSMLSAFGGGTVEPTFKKETPTEKRVRERRERNKRENQERLDKGAAVKEDEERIVREAEEAAAAEQAMIEAAEAKAARVAEEEAEAARIAEEETEAARIAEEEAEAA